MNAKPSLRQRLGRALESVTGQSNRLTTTPAYGSWLLGRISDSPRRRRVRIQTILTVFLLTANIIGIFDVVLLVAVAFSMPSIFTQAPRWLTFGVAPGYVAFALVLGTSWITRRAVNRLRWSIEDRPPSQADQHNTFIVPARVALSHLVLWGTGAALLTTLYGLVDRLFIPRFLFSVTCVGAVVATWCYLVTEFALRPLSAQALEAGPPPRRLVPGIMGRTIAVWVLGSAVPVCGIVLTGVFVRKLGNMSPTQFAFAVLILALLGLVTGFLLTWISSWLIAAPVRVVRAALKRVELGDLRGDLAVFDGTELGELQRGFNAMVDGLREQDRLRDLFGRHVGHEVVAAAEAQRIKLGGEGRHVAVVFVDIVGSTKLTDELTPTEVVALLNRFFAVVVDEVDARSGLVSKFEGDAVLAIFGAPNDLDNPEEAALAAARAIVSRLRKKVPECQAGIGVAAGQAVAGNVGAQERFEYTVVGEPVIAAARLCDLSKATPERVLASAQAVAAAGADERSHWVYGDTVTLRGFDHTTRLAAPVPDDQH